MGHDHLQPHVHASASADCFIFSPSSHKPAAICNSHAHLLLLPSNCPDTTPARCPHLHFTKAPSSSQLLSNPTASSTPQTNNNPLPFITSPHNLNTFDLHAATLSQHPAPYAACTSSSSLHPCCLSSVATPTSSASMLNTQLLPSLCLLHALPQPRQQHAQPLPVIASRSLCLINCYSNTQQLPHHHVAASTFMPHNSITASVPATIFTPSAATCCPAVHHHHSHQPSHANTTAPAQPTDPHAHALPLFSHHLITLPFILINQALTAQFLPSSSATTALSQHQHHQALTASSFQHTQQ